MTAPVPQHERETLLWRFSESSQWDRLLSTAAEALAEDPESVTAHLYMAEALINLDRKPEAEKHLQDALGRNPENAIAHRWMSMVQFAKKNYRGADESIREALALSPRDPDNWYHLAWMCHQQHDLKNGLKWATRARELAPNNPHVLNLYALCADQSGHNPELLDEVLALDPENAHGHNNRGVDLLNQNKYAEAEACFRQALAIDPTLKFARQNLFVAIKHRDLVYRILCAPRDFLIWIRNITVGDGSKRNPVAAVFGFLAWILVFKFVLLLFILWFALMWPMTKLYEFLVMGDLRKKAGEAGATRGGILGYRRWAMRWRMAIFAAGLLGFWRLVYEFMWSPARTPSERETAAMFLLCAVLATGLIYYGKHLVHGVVARYHAWKRARTLQQLENLER